jgi:hydroxypyruvate isomerase
MAATVSSLRLAANLKWLFTELAFPARFEAAAAAGFTGVEYASPYEYRPSELNGWLSDAGLAQVLINTPAGEPGSPGRLGYACLPGATEEFRAGVDLALSYATSLNAECVHVMCGAPPEGVAWARAFATLVSNLAWAADLARDTGVTLLVEVQNQHDAPGFVLHSVAQAAAAIRTVGSDRLGLLFDVYHRQVSEGDVLVGLRENAELLRHVQVSDPPTRSEPGTGELDWHAIFGELRSLAYSGWIGCEYRPLGDTLDGLAWRDRFTP